MAKSLKKDKKEEIYHVVYTDCDVIDVSSHSSKKDAEESALYLVEEVEDNGDSPKDRILIIKGGEVVGFRKKTAVEIEK